MDEAAFDSIVPGLYRAATGLETWPLAVGRMSKAMDAWGIQLIGVDKRDGTLLFSHEGGDTHPPESALDYVRTYHRVNPRVQPTLTLGPGEWFHDHERFDDDFVATNPFYQELGIPYDARYCASTKVVDDDDRLVVLAALRGALRGPFDAEERHWLERFRLHLIEAMRLQVELRKHLEPIRIGAALLDEFQRPMILIDSERMIRFANRSAKSLFDRGDFVKAHSGYLRCSDAAGDRALAQALHSLRLLDVQLTGPEIKPTRWFFKTLSQSSKTPIGVYLVELRPESTMAVFGEDPVALVFFHDSREGAGVDAMMLSETFDLTPAETRVLVGIASGRTLTEIASERGVSMATVRAQLAVLFDKTGTRRQAELVRLAMTMPSIRPQR